MSPDPGSESDSSSAAGPSSGHEQATSEPSGDNAAAEQTSASASSTTQTSGTEAAAEPAKQSSVTYSSGGGGGGGGGGGSRSKQAYPPTETGSDSNPSKPDTIAPSITAPEDAEYEATGVLTIVSLGAPAIADSVDAEPTVGNDAPLNGFPVGVTRVRWTATDDAGNTATADQKITVRDTTPPSLFIAGDIVVEATGVLSKILVDSPTVDDLTDDSPALTNDSPPEGFALGTTVLTWTAVDDSGNSRSVSQDVIVLDTKPPAIAAPKDIIHYAEEGIERATVQLGEPQVSDVVDYSPAVTNDAPDNGFPEGTTTVTWTSRDLSGNSASDTQKITVVIVVKEPAPDPPSAWKGLHGVNLVDPVLYTNGKSSWPALDTMINTADAAGFNVFRISVKWSSYVGNEQNVLNELDLIAKKTQAKGIKIWIDNFQFDTTSHWRFYNNGVLRTTGTGFPDYVVKCYVVDPNNRYVTDPAVLQFWDDYYTNKVKDSRNNCQGTMDVWKEQADFMKAIINKIDKYPNVIGYELLNEPHVWRDSHYDGLGDMHTEVGKELRTVTDKTIVFTRETTWGYNTPDGKQYTRKGNLEHKILPRITGEIRYIPHVYSLDTLEKQITQFKSYQQQWAQTTDPSHPSGYKVGLGIGEFATQPPQLPSPSVKVKNMEGFVSVFAREEVNLDDNFPVAYWAFGSCCAGEGNALTTSAGALTDAGRYYRDAIAKYY